VVEIGDVETQDRAKKVTENALILDFSWGLIEIRFCKNNDGISIK